MLACVLWFIAKEGVLGKHKYSALGRVKCHNVGYQPATLFSDILLNTYNSVDLRRLNRIEEELIHQENQQQQAMLVEECLCVCFVYPPPCLCPVATKK